MDKDNATSAAAVEIGRVKLADFLKRNKIHPQIFGYEEPKEEQIRFFQNKKNYYLQKAVMLLTTQKITQARTFLINAVREFPGDVPLIFNKGLTHYLNGEFADALKLFYSLMGKLKSRNQLLINLMLSHLQIREYEEVLDLQSEISKDGRRPDYLDYQEKQLRMMSVLAKEKLKEEEPARYQKYVKIQKDKEASIEI